MQRVSRPVTAVPIPEPPPLLAIGLRLTLKTLGAQLTGLLPRCAKGRTAIRSGPELLNDRHLALWVSLPLTRPGQAW